MHRRHFLQAAAALALSPLARARQPNNVAAGEVHADRALLWGPGQAEWSLDPHFKQVRYGKNLTGLPKESTVYYRLKETTGSFRTPHEQVRFAWGADVVGQGWGIDPSRGGMLTFKSIREAEPDFFVHVGDSIYADDPVPQRIQLDDGTWWNNLTTRAKSHKAETLEDFKKNYAYNWQDEHYREFLRKVPVVMVWSDHEVANNFGPTHPLFQLGKRAFLEAWPVPQRLWRSLRYGPHLELFVLDLRSFRDPTHIVGRQQLDWLKQALRSSPATWKVIATEIPIAGSYSPEYGLDGWADGPGPPAKRELELLELLQLKVPNVVWITGDVHYASAVHYQSGDFWEFTAGPLHAGTFAPGELDPTFRPEMAFCAVPKNLKPNRPPSDDLQFYGMVEVKPKTLTVTLHNRRGKELFRKTLQSAATRPHAPAATRPGSRSSRP